MDCFIQLHTKTPSDGDRASKSFAPNADLPSAFALEPGPGLPGPRGVLVYSSKKTVYRPLTELEERELRMARWRQQGYLP